jgi:hypothetical protein
MLLHRQMAMAWARITVRGRVLPSSISPRSGDF